VTTAAAVSSLPLTGEAEGRTVVPEDDQRIKIPPMLRFRAITPAYFRALGIRLLAGREFTANDRGQNPVAILSESAARRLWPGIPVPIGRRLRSGDDRWMAVVGVVEDTRASGIDSDLRPYLYLPFWQFAPEEFALAVRSAMDPTGLTGAVKSEIWRIDKDQPVTHVATMKQIVADSIAARRFPAVLMGIFAGFALLLAAVGVYGVVSCSVVQRSHEIGIRIALGATRLEVLADVLKGTGVLVLGGSVLGLAGSFAVTPLLRSQLYGVSQFDLSVAVASVIVLIGVAAAACYMPARRATKIDPVEALRCE
jgi:putative ABC transport system permease protein